MSEVFSFLSFFFVSFLSFVSSLSLVADHKDSVPSILKYVPLNPVDEGWANILEKSPLLFIVMETHPSEKENLEVIFFSSEVRLPLCLASFPETFN